MAKKTIKAWGGFSEGKLLARKDDGTYDEPRLSVFTSCKAASRAYQDVRRIEITYEIGE
jgi:hypothetical protein